MRLDKVPADIEPCANDPAGELITTFVCRFDSDQLFDFAPELTFAPEPQAFFCVISSTWAAYRRAGVEAECCDPQAAWKMLARQVQGRTCATLEAGRFQRSAEENNGKIAISQRRIVISCYSFGIFSSEQPAP